MSGDLSSVFTRLIEFELEHKRFMLHQNGSCEKQSKAYAETMKTLNAIKQRDKVRVKKKFEHQISDMFGILKATGKIAVKKKKK
jgi:hypothetical protein